MRMGRPFLALRRGDWLFRREVREEEMRKGKSSIVVGAQWGDEGKGRITDMLAQEADVVARFSGGPNAGHTVIVGDSRYELHLIPSGILHPEKQNIIGNGTVIHPPSLVGEFDRLEERGVSLERLYISESAHVIMPYHLALDRLEEERKGSKSIGTTRKGIGPAYTDKVARRGLQVADLLDEQRFRARLSRNLSFTNLLLTKVYGAEPVTEDEVIEAYRPFVARMAKHVVNTGLLLDRAYREERSILFEGAQGTLLDVDHGTYPFVTSSNPTAGGVCTGSGVGPTRIDEVLGVVKAYTTRVGHGPFPTEETGEVGELLQARGHEFGVTTQRTRRCGWFDLPLLRHAVRVNGLTQLALTKLDVLSGFAEIQLCTHYEIDGVRRDDFPMRAHELAAAKPVYRTFAGWEEEISSARKLEELPQAAREYLAWIEEAVGVKLVVISVGPERDQAIVRPGGQD